MNRSVLKVALLVLLFVMALIRTVPVAQAAPGDFLFLWGSQQHFNNPADLAVDASGNVYVTDTDKIHVFNCSGKLTAKWGSYGSGDGQFSYPTGIAVDGTGTVYVADSGNSRIQILSGSGKYIGKWGHPDWSARPPFAVACDGRGQVYVAESGAGGVVKVFDNQGNYLRQIGSSGAGRELHGIATDSDGNLYVGEDWSAVNVYSPTGEFVKTAVEGYFGYGLAVDLAGNVYVTNGARWDWEIEVYDSGGQLVNSLYSDDGGVLEYEHYWIPHAVAVDGKGNVYAIDGDNDGLTAFDSTGFMLRQWWSYGAWPGQLSRPQGIAVDRFGNVYETDGHDSGTEIRNNRVQVFDSQGNSLWRITADFAQTSGLAVIGGWLYVLDAMNPYLSYPDKLCNAFDLAGNLIYGLGEPVNEAFGIAVQREGITPYTRLLVTDAENSTIAVYSEYGVPVTTFGSPGSEDGQFSKPQGIAVDGSGNVFIVDSGNSRIQVFDRDLNFLRKWGRPGSSNGEFSNAAGIAVDSSGHVFVADTGNDRIQVFDTTGAFLRSWGSNGDGNAEFKGPMGVAVDGSGARVYVADTGNNRIQAFEGYSATYSLSGTVRQGSARGPILAGATVAIAGKTATSSSTGAFSITGIPAGTYTLTISRTGYATKSVSGYVVNGNKSGVVYYLTPATFSISGTVRQGSTSGPVLAGATVSLAGKSAVTSSTGTFSIIGIPAGSYTLTISKTGYATKTVTGYVVNSNKSGIVFYLAPSTYSISGTVRQGSTSGPVLPGATVSLAGKTAITSSTGTFSITGIPAGSYTLTISKSGYATKTVSGYVLNSNKSGLIFFLSPAYTISGTVREGSATGPPVSGAKVAVAGKSAITGSTGAFTVAGIPGGTYTVTLSKTGYITRTITGYSINSNRSGQVFYLAR